MRRTGRKLWPLHGFLHVSGKLNMSLTTQWVWLSLWGQICHKSGHLTREGIFDKKIHLSQPCVMWTDPNEIEWTQFEPHITKITGAWSSPRGHLWQLAFKHCSSHSDFQMQNMVFGGETEICKNSKPMDLHYINQ